MTLPLTMNLFGTMFSSNSDFRSQISDLRPLTLLHLLFSIFLFSNAQAQEKGFIRGNIADGQFGGPLIGASVRIVELSGVGSTTDFDGNYSISAPVGKYTVEVSYISFAPQVFKDVEVKAGAVAKIDATLEMATAQLDVVVVTAEVRKNSESAVLMERKNATNVSDGLSAQAFRKVGDSDLSGAMKRITGVTVQDGKYVYVRGLGDRYTVTTLNGMALPGLDPDVNSVQMDIFPTSMLENVAVYKTFSPELFGDFTGGLINIVTKKFPEEKTTEIGLGVTYIPSMHFNSDFILYNGGSLDWLGVDDGSRALPIDGRIKVPDEALVSPQLENITRAFNPQLATKSKTAVPNGSFSFNHGNQFNKESGLTLGYNVVLNYANEHVFYSEFESNDFLKNNDRSVNELEPWVTRKGVVGKNNVLWSGLLSGSIKKRGNSFSLTFLHSQNGETTAAKRVNEDINQNVSTLIEDVLTYSSRRLSSVVLNGAHKLGILELTWANATSFSGVYDPDFRETRISVTGGDTTLSTGSGAGIDRFWRDLSEIGESFKIDVNAPLPKGFELKGGVAGNMKWREFEVFNYKHRRNNLNDIELDPDWWLQEDNYWSADPTSENYRNGTYTIGNYQASNSFSARQNVFGGYLMVQQTLVKVLKIVYGARIEKVDMFYTGVSQNQSGPRYYDSNTLNEFNFMPSLNLVFNVTDKMNLRAGINQTVARPTFKEKSIAEIYDPITKRTFIGNINLAQTKINNLDLRYEWYISPKEIFALSGFYKEFTGHIEMVSFVTAPNNITPRNSGLARVAGAEIELRKDIVNWADKKSRNHGIMFNGNASLVWSFVDLNSVVVDGNGQTEFELRTNNLREGETLKSTRAMGGQSPYTVNAGLSYEIRETQTSISISYNVQGEQLTIIASGRNPDVYTVPFHSLNFNAYHSFGKKRNSRLTLSVDNIIDDDRVLVYRSSGASDQVYTRFKPGVAFGLKYNYRF
ncbi:MAG: TonB-dependent receptor [Flavobacteriales bacterium]|nr:TonB-dependent receptor [Flavobacteriales bacterium]